MSEHEPREHDEGAQQALVDTVRPGLFWQIFGVRALVTRRQYATTGLVLGALKYGLEYLVFARFVGTELSFVGFLSPFFAERARLLAGAPPGVSWLLLALSLPFLWVGVSMSVRRAVDAGWPGWAGFFFMLPGAHYVLMALLSVVPSRGPREPLAAVVGPYRAGSAQPTLPAAVPPRSLIALRPVLLSSAVGLAMFGICVYVFRSYGAALFVLTPLTMGYVAMVAYGGSLKSATVVVAASQLVVALFLIATAREGVFCILMACVPSFACGLIGAALGAAFRGAMRERRLLGIAALPLAGALEEAWMGEPPLHEVRTSIVINAPPEVVWQNVVAFPPLREPTELIFRAGVAYPQSAHIDGEGVGAVRYCTFSTGSFVEPITVWTPGEHLAFDVDQNPPPMRELSPYGLVDAPHLKGFMRSRQGEFRLTALPDGRTELEGTTWYQIDMAPEMYWRWWTDGIVHSVHGRVLEHIARTSEVTDDPN